MVQFGNGFGVVSTSLVVEKVGSPVPFRIGLDVVSACVARVPEKVARPTLLPNVDAVADVVLVTDVVAVTEVEVVSGSNKASHKKTHPKVNQ